LVPPIDGSNAVGLEVGGEKVTEYDKALKALDWLNRKTDYRANNISTVFSMCYKEKVGGMFGLSKFSTQKSLGVVTGKELIKTAEREGWKDE
jgi:hypothetical protein